MERIAAGLTGIGHHAYDLLFSLGSQISLTSLACALAIAATLPVVQHVMQDAPFPAVLLSVPLHVDARAANNWDEAH